MSDQAPTDDRQKHWLVRRSTIRKLSIIGLVILAAITALGAVVHGHPHFVFDGWFGFYSAFGFLTCTVIVVFAKLLKFVLKRKDTYYDE